MKTLSISRRLWRDQSAAIAASYALSLVPLVALAGLAYDFAQAASLDTEVQNAADQAALAAATQLGGTATSIANATGAASNLLVNSSVMANDGKPVALTVDSLIFYKTAADAENDTNPTTDPLDAKFVKVSIASRQARFALTPIVGAVMSDAMAASATAGMGTAMCNIPPVMMCNPVETADPDFDGPAPGNENHYVGRGVRLVSVTNSGGGAGLSPGNFGYLDTGSTESNQLLALKIALGWDRPDGGCIATTGVSTKPGANTPVTLALNTRFDIYDNGGPGGGACPAGGVCSPSINTVKDLVRETGSSQCTASNNGWHESDKGYLPDQTGYQDPAKIVAMGHPRDICHSKPTPDCSEGANGAMGTGAWDRSTYFNVNYPGFTTWATALGTATPTRYQVYKWEIANRNDTYINSSTGLATTFGGVRVADVKAGGGTKETQDYNTPICQPPGVVPSTATIDRRTFPVALVNCTAAGVKGQSSGIPVTKWINVFFVEPSANRKRTQPQDVYVEIVSVNKLGNSDGGAAAVVRRDKPYLLK